MCTKRSVDPLLRSDPRSPLIDPLVQQLIHFHMIRSIRLLTSARKPSDVEAAQL